MINFNTFYNYALDIKNNLNLRMFDSKIEKICLDALEVKYWDRIDNLSTSEIYDKWNEKNLTKAYRKIEETKKYFYNISKETHPYIANLIIDKVEGLEEYIRIKKQKNTIEDVKNELKKKLNNKS
jgi:hypothetical protein